MTEGETPKPAPDRQDPDRLITDFAERVPGVLRAAVVASDGVLVAASNRTQPDQLEQLSATTAGLISLAGAAGIFGGGAVAQALVTMAQGTLVIMAIDQGSSLAVLTTATAHLDTVAYEMTMLVEEAGRIFTSPAR
jgi:predicted regulator of Ras-like GTPase activity (Roadblock/LC7/MglB family)